MSALEPEVGPHSRLHFLRRPERSPHQIDVGGLHSGKTLDLALRIAHDLRPGRAAGRGQRHVDFDLRPFNSDRINKTDVHDVKVELGVLHPSKGELHLILTDYWSGRNWLIGHTIR